MISRGGDITMFLILCFLVDLAVGAGEDRWIYWDVDRRSMSLSENHWESFNGSNLAEFTAVGVRNFDGRYNFGQLETKFQNAVTLKLQQCDIAIINKAFEGQFLRNIKSLSISSDYGRADCPNIANLTLKFTNAKFPQLERFEVRNHEIKTNPKQFVPSLNLNLKALSIKWASLKRLPSDLFMDYKALEEINLKGNILVSFNSTTFAGNVNLKVLDLSHNRLAELPEQIFQHNVNLRELRMDTNQIDAIPPQFFASNRKLREVNFARNRIQRLPPKLFEGMTELRYVLLYHNQIKSLGAGLFKDCSKLMLASFHHNLINKISPDSIYKAQSLQKFYFAYNPCTEKTCISNWEKTADWILHDKSSCATWSGDGFSVGEASPAPRGEYPWSAALFYERSFICGSSLISSKHILTAAHCIKNKKKTEPIDPAKALVAFGRNNFDDDDELPDSKTRKIVEFVLHPDWDASSIYWDGDLAIGVLKNAFKNFTEFYRPICLNEMAIGTLHGKKGKVVGWGSTDAINGTGSSVAALEIKVKIVSDDECEDQTENLTYLTHGSAFCAGNITRSAACHGDSGGALFVVDQHDNLRYKAVGIVSSGLRGSVLCSVDNYQLYTDVALYRTWIEETVFETY